MKNLVTQPHAIFSVENSPYPDKVASSMNHEQAIAHLQSKGPGKVHSIAGHYGSPERSIFVSNPSPEQSQAVRHLALQTGQESHIESDGTNHKMLYNHGPKAGTMETGTGTDFHAQKPADFYSQMPDGTTFTHRFGKTEELNKGANGNWKKEGYKLKINPNATYHKNPAIHIQAVHPIHGVVGESFIGRAKDGSHIYPHDTNVDPNHQRKGIASAMYNVAEKHTGLELQPLNSDQSDDAVKLWDHRLQRSEVKPFKFSKSSLKKSSLQKMSQPRITFPNFPKVSTRPDQNVQMITTGKQKELFGRKAANASIRDAKDVPHTDVIRKPDGTLEVGPQKYKDISNQPRRDKEAKSIAGDFGRRTLGMNVGAKTGPISGALGGKLRSKFEEGSDEDKAKIDEHLAARNATVKDYNQKYGDWQKKAYDLSRQATVDPSKTSEFQAHLAQKPVKPKLPRKPSKKAVDTTDLSPEAAISRGRSVGSTVEHEGFHNVMDQMDQHYGPDEAQRAEHSLLSSFDPATLKAVGSYISSRMKYKPRSKHFSEEVLAHARDILVDPKKRESFKKFLGPEADQHIKNLKVGMRRANVAARNLKPQERAEPKPTKLAASELKKGLSPEELGAQGYKFKILNPTKSRDNFAVRAYHGNKAVGHLVFSSNANSSPENSDRSAQRGYHSVSNGHISEDHRGNGLYQHMINMAGKHAKSIGSKGVYTSGSQRSKAATNAWQKVASHATRNPYTFKDRPTTEDNADFYLAASELKKTPIIHEQDEDFAPKMLDDNAFDPNFHENLKSTKVGPGLYHHIYNVKGSPTSVIHSLGINNPSQPHSIIVGQTSNNHEKDGVEANYVATFTATEPDHQGKGFGTKLKELALKHHGSMQSDHIVSPGENRSWEKLSGSPTARVKMGLEYEGDDLDDPDEANHAAYSPHVATYKKTKLAASELSKSRGKLTFPKLKTTTRPDQQVQNVDTPNQEKLFSHKVALDAVGRDRRDMTRLAVQRHLKEAKNPNLAIQNVKNLEEDTGAKLDPKDLISSGAVMSTPNRVAHGHGMTHDENANPTSQRREHEAIHILFQDLAHKHGKELHDHAQKEMNNLIHPDVRSALSTHMNWAGYAPEKHPTEYLSHLYEMLHDPKSRTMMVATSGQKHNERDLMGKAKKSWNAVRAFAGKLEDK